MEMNIRMKSFTDDSATYAAPVLLQIAGMARRSKRDFAGYLLEMAAAVLEQDLPGPNSAEHTAKS